MVKKTETKASEKVEREYTIPLRKKCKPVSRYKKTNKAIKTIKEFLVRHMKIRDRNLNKIKIDKYLNEAVWFRGIRNPPSKIKVKAVSDENIVRVELVEMPNKLKFKKLREEKIEKKAEEIVKKKEAEKVVEAEEVKEEKKPEDEEKAKEESEKKAAVVEAGKQMEKAAAKKAKHEVGGKIKQPKHQQRKALAK